jgi:deoxyinosine 3'endonuclease (endonuclease V)
LGNANIQQVPVRHFGATVSGVEKKHHLSYAAAMDMAFETPPTTESSIVVMPSDDNRDAGKQQRTTASQLLRRPTCSRALW